MLIDLNDNPPEFELSIYAFTVSESAAVGSTVGRVFATSRDTGVNADITYVINEGSNNFAINDHTGEDWMYNTLWAEIWLSFWRD